MRWVVLVVALGLGVNVGACGASLSSSGAQVRVGKSAPEGESCHELGIVYGSGSGGAYTSGRKAIIDSI